MEASKNRWDLLGIPQRKNNISRGGQEHAEEILSSYTKDGLSHTIQKDSTDDHVRRVRFEKDSGLSYTRTKNEGYLRTRTGYFRTRIIPRPHDQNWTHFLHHIQKREDRHYWNQVRRTNLRHGSSDPLRNVTGLKEYVTLRTLNSR